jgi:hypothetical protein
MTISKRTILDQVEIARDGAVQVRIGLELVEGGQTIACRWHRTSVAPGGSVAEQMAAVNVHLTQMNEIPVGAEDIARIEAYQRVT